jgi:5-methylcytosine-specific restriction endonuclease McrA
MSATELTERAQQRAARARLRKRYNRRQPYGDYLASADWAARRAEILRRAGHRCELCGATGVPLDVHHLTYERRGDERYADLKAICRACHTQVHRRGGTA